MTRILWAILVFTYFTNIIVAQKETQNKQNVVQKLKSRTDVKVNEVEKGILKFQYPNGKLLYKNIGDYKQENKTLNKTTYSPNFDSTIIDLNAIDTSLYSDMYSFWQEVPIHNWDFDHIRIGDINNNGKPELYGARKFYSTPQEPVSVYELNDDDKFVFVHQYDSGHAARDIFDIDKDGEYEFLLTGNYPTPIQLTSYHSSYKKMNSASLATEFNFTFEPFQIQSQLNDLVLDDLDGDQFTDLLFVRAGEPDVHIYEYNPITNNFDSVYRFDVNETPPWANSGFSIGDFDLDGNKDIVFGTGRGAVYVLENEGDNQYKKAWLGSVQSYHAYVHAWTNDIDGNGKPEFWVLADAYYNDIGITRITIFETNGNDSYHAVAKVDLVGVFSFYAGTMQAIDIDNDGVEEIAICIDDNFLILKFNGSQDFHSYELYYIKKSEQYGDGEWITYYGATMNDLSGDGKNEILISLLHILKQPLATFETWIYKPEYSTGIKTYNKKLNEFELFQNYPNPFNNTTNLSFSLGYSTNVKIKVYNILGEEIKKLLNKNLVSGKHTIQWNGEKENGQSLSSGIYYFIMKAGSYQKTIKTILLK